MMALAACCLFLPALAGAQATCTYTIEMFDSFGDGWDGGVLTVNSNGTITTHTIPFGSNATSTFTVTHGAPIEMSYVQGTFIFEPSFNILDADGMVIFSSTSPIPGGDLFSTTGFCPSCPIPNVNLVIIDEDDITDSTANVNWLNVNVAESYIVEYGPSGFPLGIGLTDTVTSSNVDLQGLNPCVTYDVYIASVCGVDSVSSYIGPYDFSTTYTPGNPGAVCTYTLQLLSTFGFGWNGAFLTVTTGATSNTYTLDFGSEILFSFDAVSNVPIELNYSPGFFEDGNVYNLIDPNGNVVFTDGPFPFSGDVATIIACPTCPGPLDAWLKDVNALNARLAWQPSQGAQGNYIIEYGPFGFTLGTGTVVTVPNEQAEAVLTGLAENSWYDVYIKLDCTTEFSKSVGPRTFHTLRLNDLGITGITAPDPGTQCNLEEDETVTIAITNFGQAPQTLFNFFFAVNGVVASVPVPQDGLYTGVIGNDSTETISFETTWDFSEPGLYVIQAWTVLDGDSQSANDTFTYQIVTAFPKPLQEDFENLTGLPTGWTSDEFFLIYAPLSHNNESWVAADNVFSGDPSFNITTHRIGPIESGDSLTFDYRFVNWFAGTTATTLGTTDKLEVQISSDCGDNYQTVLTINSVNHVPSVDMANKAINLTPFAGDAINIRFLHTWGSGDYWVDLDNINIAGCPPSLGLLASVSPSIEGEATGVINVSPFFGTEPYSFVWEQGDSTGIISGLAPGTYAVTVTDANGCVDTKEYEISSYVADHEVTIAPEIKLYPNPSNGMVWLDVAFPQATDFSLRLMNTSGQVIFEKASSKVIADLQELDLSQQAPGMYIVQIVADGTPYYAKLMLTNR